jgi:hypothetical protein
MNQKSAWKVVYRWARQSEREIMDNPKLGWRHFPFSQIRAINLFSMNFNDDDEDLFRSLPDQVKKAAWIVAEVRDKQVKALFGPDAWTELDRRDFSNVSLTEFIAKVRS